MITRSAQYALRALVAIASEPQKKHGAQELARLIEAPPNYMGKLLKLLAVSGVLESFRGSGGGFRLARPASEIRLIDIIDPIDRVSRWSSCFLGRGDCTPCAPCPMHNHWKPIRESYIELLQSATLSDLPGAMHELISEGQKA
ncbi:MAG TPA: Rrf2 family transcriptional regulator [Spirochaetia bacterium]|nr:Rrf2 family transcriptional regulator [Spirochaetia bacterium]